MSQNSLIDNIHDNISEDDSTQKVLAGYTEDPTIWGYSKVWLFFMLIPAMVGFHISAIHLEGALQLYGFFISIILAALGVIATIASPSDMEAREYVESVVSHHAHQQTMTHDTDPDNSQIEQPTNESLPGRIARLPVVRDYPIIGAGEYEPSQSLVAHTKAFKGEYAIQREDGSLIGAIRVHAIPLRLESGNTQQKVETAVANAFEGTIDYNAQLISPTRKADFQNRHSRWKARARVYQSEADRLASTLGDNTTTDVIRQQILADIANERAAGINLYEETKRIREHYVLVSVDPGDVVIDRSSETGGLGSIPGLGRLIESKRVREQKGTDEHTIRMIEKLEQRVTDLAAELRRIEGLQPQPVPAVDFSEVVADYYRGTNVRAYPDFTQAIRGSPVPRHEDADDPEHDVSFDHITALDLERSGDGSTPALPPGTASAHAGGHTVDEEAKPIVASDEAVSDTNPEDTTVHHTDAVVGVPTTEEEREQHYKSALAPHKFEKRDDYCEIDGNYCTRTLKVRDWPANPMSGFFDRVVSFSMPEVDVTISTHLAGKDERDADRELSEAADGLKQKVKDFSNTGWLPDYFVEQAANEYAAVKRTQKTVSTSPYGLYEANTYIEVRAPTEDMLDKAVGRIRSRMQDVSADAKPLEFQHQLGYRTAAPACKDFIGGNTKMTGDGVARLIPWTARNLIEPNGIELGINEDTGDPIVLDLQNRETGFNVGVWGTIGSGKTTTVTRLLLRSKMLNPDMPVVIIDPKEEFAGLTWLFGGERVVIGSNTGVNPLQIEETPPEKLREIGTQAPYRNAVRRAMDFVRSFYQYMDISFEEKQGTWRTAIQEAYRRRGITIDPSTHHHDSPTLKDDVFPIFAEMAQNPEKHVPEELTDVDVSMDDLKGTASKILQNDVGALQTGGEFEHLSKATDIDVNNIDVLYLDLQNYENETTAGLMMGPLITAVLEQAKEIDEPMALAMDEFHYMLHNSSSLETLKQAYRHSRHSDLSLITATQSVEEFFTENEAGERQLTKSASQLTNLMSVKIWHYLEEMDEEWAAEFDMSKAEMNHIKDAATGDPTAQAVLQTQKKGSYRLDVDYSNHLNPREFAMNQFDPTDHGADPIRYLDNYTDRNGQDVTQWTWTAPSDRPQTSVADDRARLQPTGSRIQYGESETDRRVGTTTQRARTRENENGQGDGSIDIFGSDVNTAESDSVHHIDSDVSFNGEAKRDEQAATDDAQDEPDPPTESPSQGADSEFRWSKVMRAEEEGDTAAGDTSKGNTEEN